MRHLQLAADLTGPRALQREPEDLVPQVVRQRAPIRELAAVLVHVAATCAQRHDNTIHFCQFTLVR